MVRPAALVLRIALGAIFVYAAWVKLREPWELFALAINSYDLLPLKAVELVARTLPWLEMAIGLMLIVGRGLRITATVTSLVLLVFIGVMLSVFQQFVGINVVLYYATDIFKGMGLTTNVSLFQTIIVGAVNLLFTIVAILTVDYFGRRPLQIIGALVMAVSMIALGMDFWIGGKGMVALVCMLAYTAGFAVSWGPVTWVLLSEIFPNQIRGKAMAVAVAAQWIANYLVSWTFPILDNNPYLVDHFKHGFAYWIYGVMGVLAALFMWRVVPETKGRTLEQMEAIWQGEGK